MGGWIALLAARAMRARGLPEPAGLVLVAPAADFTERLMWAQFPPEVRATIERDGVWHRHSEYAPEPYPITRGLIEDGRRHLVLDAPIPFAGPVRILQGMRDPDVPWQHALRTAEALTSKDVTMTLVKDGDHRLSGEADLARLVEAVAAL
jgi:alpha-beta hydrolase superfamily lysophospholipase